MKDAQLDRLFKLVKKTNDRLVVLDKETDFVTVMVPLDDYEKLIDGGEAPDLDEGGFYPDSGPDDEPPTPPTEDFAADLPEEEGEEQAPEEPVLPPEPSYTRIALAEKQDEAERHGSVPVYKPGEKTLDFSGNWAAENAKPITEEDLSDVPEEEEKFYLEPVE